ncbi:13334_t:CDS:2 [Ambispora gerdemannii]|uniref:13334_t:CDS:1 n=1 Tax=Ambispora gerdemannii TaxID=144530 RepID=A0A9N9C2I0_9GLOM|nr:13334_t:CDS:2 [Ambispora gerdemannii]
MAASASNNATEEKQAPTLAEVVRKLDTEKLIEFLRGEEDLQLNDAHFEILRKREIAGRDFLKMDKQDFRDCGLEVGPAIRLVDFAKEVKEKKLRAFSTYRTLKDFKEVLANYKLGDSILNEGVDIPTLSNCHKYNGQILSVPLRAFTVLSCGHILHRTCIQEIIMGTEAKCPVYKLRIEIIKEEDGSEVYERTQSNTMIIQDDQSPPPTAPIQSQSNQTNDEQRSRNNTSE